LNRLHSASVSAKTSTEKVSATLRTSFSLCSSFRTKSSRMAPAIGRAINELRIGNFTLITTKDTMDTKGRT